MKLACCAKALLLSALFILPLSADFLLKKELVTTPLSFSLKKRPSSPSRYFFQLTKTPAAVLSNLTAVKAPAVYELHYDETMALRKIAAFQRSTLETKKENQQAPLVVQLTKRGTLETVREQLSPFLSLTLRFNFLEQIEEKTFALGKNRLTEKYVYYSTGLGEERLATVAFYKNNRFLGRKKYRYLSRVKTEAGTKESVRVEYYNAAAVLLSHTLLEQEKFGNETLIVETHYDIKEQGPPSAQKSQQQKIRFFSGGKLQKETVQNAVAIDYRYDAEGKLSNTIYRSLNGGKVLKEYRYRYRQLPAIPTLAELSGAFRRETLESSSIEQFTQLRLGKTLAPEAFGMVVGKKELLKNFNQQIVFFSLKQYSATTDTVRWEKQITGVSLTSLFFKKKRLVRKTLRALQGPFKAASAPLGEYRYSYYQTGPLAGKIKQVAFYAPLAKRASQRIEYAYLPEGETTVKFSKRSPEQSSEPSSNQSSKPSSEQPPLLGKRLFLSLAKTIQEEPRPLKPLLADLAEVAQGGFSKATLYQQEEEKQLVLLERKKAAAGALRLIFSYYQPDQNPYYLRATAKERSKQRTSKQLISSLKKRIKLQARISITYTPPLENTVVTLKAQWDKFEPESGRKIFSLALEEQNLWARHFAPSALTVLLKEEKKVRLKTYQELRLFLEHNGEAL